MKQRDMTQQLDERAAEVEALLEALDRSEAECAESILARDKQLTERNRTIGELRGRVKILERDNAELERDRDYWKECALAFQERAETSDQLGDTLKRTHELWTKEREKRFQLTGRLATVADEAFGPFSVQSAEENLTAIERGVFELKHQLAERDRTIEALERVKAKARQLVNAFNGDASDSLRCELLDELEALSNPGKAESEE